jgi:hypothetical protein
MGHSPQSFFPAFHASRRFLNYSMVSVQSSAERGRLNDEISGERSESAVLIS